jgi:hypothetical protein
MQTWHRDDRAQVPSGARNQHRVSGDQQDSVDSAGQHMGQQLAIWKYSFAGMNLQLLSLSF